MMTRFRRLPSRSALPLAIGVLLVCSVGCGKTGTVKGIVKQADGTPLPGGLIMFAPEEAGKSAATGVIKEDGTYEVEVPKGAFKVSIDNRAAGQVETLVGVGGLTGSGGGKGPGGTDMAGPPAAKGGGEAAIADRMKEAGKPGITAKVPVPGRVVPVNPKYFSPDLSQLTIKVAGGSNEFNVTLEK